MEKHSILDVYTSAENQVRYKVSKKNPRRR